MSVSYDLDADAEALECLAWDRYYDAEADTLADLDHEADAPPTSAPSDALPPLPFVPKKVSPSQQPQVQPNRSLPGYPVAQPVWGVSVRQLVSGGRWRTETPVEPLRRQDGRPRKPRSVEVYPNEIVIEPDPSVSSYTITLQLLRSFYRSGWSLAQAEDALGNPAHAGGLYARYLWATGKDFLPALWDYVRASDSDPFYAPAPDPVPCNRFSPLLKLKLLQGEGKNDSTCVPEKRPPARPPRSVPITRKPPRPYVVSRSDSYAVLALVRSHPNVSQSELIRLSAMRNSRVRGALARLEADGRIRADNVSIRTPAGGRRAVVWSLAESPAGHPAEPPSPPTAPPTTQQPDTQLVQATATATPDQSSPAPPVSAPGITPLPSHLDRSRIDPEKVAGLLDLQPDRRRISADLICGYQRPDDFAECIRRWCGLMAGDLPGLEILWYPTGIRQHEGVVARFSGAQVIGTTSKTSQVEDYFEMRAKADAAWSTATGEPSTSTGIHEWIRDAPKELIGQFLARCHRPGVPVYRVGAL